jgi:hypothetical protein
VGEEVWPATEKRRLQGSSGFEGVWILSRSIDIAGPKSSRPFTYRDKRTYQWRTDGTRRELLTAGRAVATVEPDTTYAGMWRIVLGEGALSDMVNSSRAKDAAVRLADARQVLGKPSATSPWAKRSRPLSRSSRRENSHRRLSHERNLSNPVLGETGTGRLASTEQEPTLNATGYAQEKGRAGRPRFFRP